ncbi:uncharacterized protein LOC122377325 [Amphibalanus amphitrite]|uniref:uncharacterized protein LOC122377325 n=1 Tax=Amphibalanus amphitrite TaxID=1232801 RepID=UPI001C929073|nr:uncharacterized protein LOC122377325 [Amphibalanus amphitrite]
MVNGRIRAYLEGNYLLSPHQTGFRSGRCTADNIVHLIDDIQKGFQNDMYTFAVFIDFQNAFDKVNKQALLIKLHKTGIRGHMAHYISNFLKDRTFNVRCGNTFSPNLNQDHGLPQGSVLSPTLFLIMINDLFQNPPSSLKHSIFADDVAIWVTRRNIDSAFASVQNAMEDINSWCDKWGLVLSPSKTVALIFSHKSRFKFDTELKVKNQTIKYVKTFKYLGITLDSRLSFKHHFQDVKMRCTRRLNILKCIAGKDWGADRSTLLNLYTSLIRPILDYNSFLFDDIASNQIESLQVIQNKALRIVTGAQCTTNIKALHAECNIPLLSHRRKLQLLRFYARTFLSPYSPSHRIVSNRYTDDPPTTAQLKYPIIAYRIERTLSDFQLDFPSIFHRPPISSFFLPAIENIAFLYAEAKSKVTKEESIQLFYEHKEEHKDYAYIYTDGSVCDGRTAAAVTSDHHNKTSRLHDDHSIFSAELIAIHSALKYVSSKNIEKAVICTDSASSVKAIAHRKMEKNEIVYKIKKMIIGFTDENKHVILLWIPSHVGIQGNEKADKLAKEGLHLPSRNHLALPLPDFLSSLFRAFQRYRQKCWIDDHTPHLFSIKPKLCHFYSSHQNTRIKERVLARLRLGHTQLTHNYILDRAPPPICHHCRDHPRYTISHFLLHCPHLHQHRRHIVQYINTHGLSLDLPTLLGDTHPDIHDLLFVFLADARIIKSL